MAPISKKLGAGSTGKTGTGLGKSSSGKTASGFGSVGKSGKFGSSTKSENSKHESGINVSAFGSTPKSSNSFDSAGKSGSSFGKSAITSDLLGKKPLYSSGKAAAPLIIGGKSTSGYAASPEKSYPSTSFSNPKKPSTSLGFIWIPTKKRNKKKEYVHVSHRSDGLKDRSPSMYAYDL